MCALVSYCVYVLALEDLLGMRVRQEHRRNRIRLYFSAVQGPLRGVISSPFDTLAGGNLSLGEDTTSEWRATDHRSEHLKPPDLLTEELKKSVAIVSVERHRLVPRGPGTLTTLGLHAHGHENRQEGVEPAAHTNEGRIFRGHRTCTSRENRQHRARWRG